MRFFKVFNLVVILLLLSGCGNKNEITNLNKQIEELNTQYKNLQDINSGLIKSNEVLKTKNKISVEEYKSTILSLQNEIKENDKIINILQGDSINSQPNNEIADLRIYDLSLAPNKQFASIMVIDYNTSNVVAFLYDFSSKTAKVITDGNVCETFWSPDSKYFVIDSGTFVTRVGELYSIESLEVIKLLAYNGQLLWVNSEEVVYARENDNIQLDANVDPPNTTDVVIHNVFTDEIKTIFEGTDQYLYYVSDVIDGRIECLKSYIGSKVEGRENETVTYDYN